MSQLPHVFALLLQVAESVRRWERRSSISGLLAEVPNKFHDTKSFQQTNLNRFETLMSVTGAQLNKASNSSPPSSQGSTRPVRPASDLLDLDEKLSNITNFSVMRHESVSSKPGEAPRLHVRKVSDPGLCSSSELASLDSAAERADTSRTLTAEVQTGRFRLAPAAMIGEAKENITDF